MLQFQIGTAWQTLDDGCKKICDSELAIIKQLRGY
jgi:hypothetical protein